MNLHKLYLTFAAAVTLGAAIAIPGTAQGSNESPADWHRRTIRVVETDGADGGFDVEPRGDSIGDYFAFHGWLDDLAGNRVGRVDGYSVLTGTGDAAGALHFVTLTLPGGQITTQNTELPGLDNGNGAEAITGGTGEYQNAGGQVTFEDHSDHIVIVIDLIR